MLTHTVFQRRYRMKYSEMEEVDEIVADPSPDPARDAAAPLARQPAGDRLGGRRPGRHRHGLLGRLHGVSAEGTCARPADFDHSGSARRGRVRDRDRRARRARRQAGPVRRSARRRSARTRSTRTGASRSSRWSWTRPRSGACAISCCCSTPVRRARRRRCSSDQDERSKAGDERDAREPAPHQGARAQRSCELLRERRSRRLRGTDARALGAQARSLARGWPTSTSTGSTCSRGAAA